MLFCAQFIPLFMSVMLTGPTKATLPSGGYQTKLSSDALERYTVTDFSAPSYAFVAGWHSRYV